MNKNLLFEIDEAVAILTINDEPYNRMSLNFMDELEVAVKEIAACRSFFGQREGEGVKKMGSADALFDQRLKVISEIENMNKPWIVTMFGYCLGGGLEIPLGCHFRLAAIDNAQIGLPELDLGAVPAWGGSARLTKCVGEQHALDMILRSKKISGPRALEIGLVHEVWPLEELKSAAISLAHELAAQPAKAVESMMKVLVNSSDRELEELLKAERQAVKDNSGTKDSQEGMAAFLEKRKPLFNQ